MQKDFQAPHPSSCGPLDIANDRYNDCVYACLLIKDKFGRLQKFKCQTVDLKTHYRCMDYFMCLHRNSTKQTFLDAQIQNKRFFTQLKIEAIIPYQNFEEREFAQHQLFKTLKAVFELHDFELKQTKLYNPNLHQQELRLEWQQQQLADVFFGLEQSKKLHLYMPPYTDDNSQFNI